MTPPQSSLAREKPPCWTTGGLSQRQKLARTAVRRWNVQGYCLTYSKLNAYSLESRTRNFAQPKLLVRQKFVKPEVGGGGVGSNQGQCTYHSFLSFSSFFFFFLFNIFFWSGKWTSARKGATSLRTQHNRWVYRSFHTMNHICYLWNGLVTLNRNSRWGCWPSLCRSFWWRQLYITYRLALSLTSYHFGPRPFSSYITKI